MTATPRLQWFLAHNMEGLMVPTRNPHHCPRLPLFTSGILQKISGPGSYAARGQPFDPPPQPRAKPETAAEWPVAAGAQLQRASGWGGQAGGSSGFRVCGQVTMLWAFPSSSTATPALHV